MVSLATAMGSVSRASHSLAETHLSKIMSEMFQKQKAENDQTNILPFPRRSIAWFRRCSS